MSNAPVQAEYPKWNTARRFRAARELLGKTQQEFAELTDISRRTIIKYEDGSPTTPRVVRDWARACGVTVEWIHTGVEPSNDRGPNGGTIIHLDDHRNQDLGSDQQTAPYTCNLHQLPRAA